MTALNLITDWMNAVRHPWGSSTPSGEQATAHLLAEVEALAQDGDRQAARLWDELRGERDYAATNAANNDPMHRKLPYYDSILHRWHSMLTAETNPSGVPTGWCETCRRRREVIEVDDHASFYRGDKEIEVSATHLACGHTMTSEERVVGASPGGGAAAEAIRGAEVQRRVARTAEAAFGGGDL